MLHGLNFAVRRGSVTGLLGSSGGGKTTLMRAIVGVQAGVRGRVEMLGEPAGSPSLRARIGYVAQSLAVYADLSVRANLVASQMVGLAVARYVIRLEPLASAGAEELPPAVGPTVDRYLTEPLD